MATVRVLPPVLEPGDKALKRRHAPRRGAFSDYRACLRWDFGFVCAMCRLHEADFVKHGAAGTGMMWIEHLEPQSTAAGEKKKNLYRNCYYTCRYCNHRRRALPRRTSAGTILDPCREPWTRHFDLLNDRLQARTTDAARTEEAYVLNDDRKVALRRHRRERVADLLELLDQIPAQLASLVKQQQAVRGAKRAELLGLAKTLRRSWKLAEEELAGWRMVPLDKDSACRCKQAKSRKKNAARRRIPRMYAKQAVVVGVRS